MTDRLETGMNAYHAGDFERAIQVLGQLLEEDTSQVEAKLWLGASLVAQGETNRAIFMFRRVLKEGQSPQIRNYARQMLSQLDVPVDPLEPEIEAPPAQVLEPREVSFNILLREICLLSEDDLIVVRPHLERYVQDPGVFKEELAAGFTGTETAANVLAGLLGFSSLRRQAECKGRIQSFITSPNRVCEQTLGVYVRSVEPGIRG